MIGLKHTGSISEAYFFFLRDLWELRVKCFSVCQWMIRRTADYVRAAVESGNKKTA